MRGEEEKEYETRGGRGMRDMREEYETTREEGMREREIGGIREIRRGGYSKITKGRSWIRREYVWLSIEVVWETKEGRGIRD